MFHLVGKTLTVLATLGAVLKVGEYLHEREENDRLRQFEEEAKKRRMTSERESKLQEKKAREAAIKRREKHEAEIKRILYGIPVELPTPVQKRPWWRFVKSNIDAPLQPQSSSFPEDEAELKAQEEFRARHPFIQVKVPSRHMDEFLQEFAWLEKKLGSFPSAEDQKAILIGIIRNS